MIKILQCIFILAVISFPCCCFIINRKKEPWLSMGIIGAVIGIIITFLGFIAPVRNEYKIIPRNEYEIVKSSDTVWIQYKDLKEEFTDAKTYNTIDKKSKIYIKEGISTAGLHVYSVIVTENE